MDYFGIYFQTDPNQRERLYLALERAGNMYRLPRLLAEEGPSALKDRSKTAWTSVRKRFSPRQGLVAWGEKLGDWDWVSLEQLESESAGLIEDHGAMICEALSFLWPNMPTAKTDRVLLPKRYTHQLDTPLKRCTFYGGSFNPWHEGHGECLRLCPDSRLLVVPDHSPWKAEKFVEGCYLASYLALVAELSPQGYGIFPGFWGLEHANPTVGWLPSVEVENKWLLMGSDSFMSLDKWKDFRQLMEILTGIYVVQRQDKIEEVRRKKKFFCSEFAHLAVEVLTENRHPDVSSSGLRK